MNKWPLLNIDAFVSDFARWLALTIAIIGAIDCKEIASMKVAIAPCFDMMDLKKSSG
jgi:hypothetical protein